MSWHAVVDFAKQNEVVLALAVTAAIATMPDKDAPFSWRTFYAWIYEGAHLFLNFRRPTLPAETPANPKP